MSETPVQIAFNIPPRCNPTPLPSTSQTEPAPKKKKAAETSVDIDEHNLSSEAAADKYKTKVNNTTPGDSFGLSDEEAATRLEVNGPNCLTPPKKKSAILRYLEFLANLFNLLLIVAGVLNFILVAIDPIANKDSTIFGIVLIAVAFINATIEYYQEAKSAAILQSFLNMIPAQANVLRAGKLSSLPARELVTGDIVFIRLGDKVPADLLIVHASELKVDNSSLTGEAEPQERKNTNTTGAKNPLEAVNLVFNGTLAVAGEGYGIVIRTGDQTVLGQIAGMTDGEEKRPSPMSVEIDNLVKFTAFIAVVFAIVFFIVGFKVYPNIASNVNFAIGMLVAFVPQGLPATVSMLLTIAAKRLAKQNVLCKDLHGVETLGAITLLATDKTGTLTRNAMTVTNVWTGLNLYSATRSATDKGSPFVPDMLGAKEVLAGATLNTRARFDRTDVPLAERTVIGDATESGLMRWASSLLPDYDQYATTYPKVFEIPFNSDNKWAMTLHKKAHPTGDLTLFQKGAPERILRLCTTIYIDGQAVPLTDAHRQAYNDAYEFLAGTGQRVLAFAQALLPRSEFPLDYVFDKETANYPTDTLTFLGLVSLEDPPKHGVREAIGRCRSAGVQIIMVTGDHPLTAEAIGRKINLMISETKSQIAKRRNVPIEQIDENEVDAIVIHGDHIDEMEDEDWDVAFSKSEIIFARTSPKHKLAIVKRAQGMGHIVGVTGDGVNDAPALKTADLGIAMNISGSDVSKEAATMILLDDNFASVVRGIEQGRLIFVNLKKSIQYTLTHITPEVIPSLLYILVPLPLPISPILILLIDLGFELIAALSFAWDRPESSGGLMKLPPRKPVTFASIDRFRNRAARQAAERKRLGYRTDHESGKEVQPSWPVLALDKLKTPFKAQLWRDKFEDTEDEVLVDANSMSYSYLEMGLIQTFGALVAYFAALWYYGISPSDAKTMQGDSEGTFGTSSASPLTIPSSGVSMDANAQATALGTAQAAYYLSIMILQMWNLFIVKGRNRLPFGKFMVSNYMSFVSVVLGSGFGFFLVYTPDVNSGLKAHSVPVVILCISFGFGVVELLYATLRILFLRKFRPQKLNAEIDGLQMYPTVRSARSGRSNK